MASGEPSPCLMKQIQNAFCRLCGKSNETSPCERKVVNYQKQVDEPHVPYTQIIPDSRYEEMEAFEKRAKTGGAVRDSGCKSAPLQICLHLPSSLQQSLTSAEAKTAPKEQAPAKEAENSATVKVNRLLLFLLSACCPTGNGCPPPVKMMLCLPCPAPDASTSSSSAAAQQQKKKPRDYTYRCESRELRGGNLYQCCQCLKRNGLQHDCPRTPCQGRPACLVKPWPDCWPSGGCHGIDYSRENGVKRYDPCSEQRFDKKDCRPPGSRGGTGGGKSECEGNMMIFLCPQQPQN
ncbi:UNVERIFIED_CONTAM: hypothetical protein PYX00_000903 [Menopon gallinae]|uniref:Uncharacterized protein n=1 Tax=Menopon gallinae TaxID=328185 RepID=A0AAW2IAT9_9NEOP